MGTTLAKRGKVVQIDQASPAEATPEPRGNSKEAQLIEFWERRSGRRLNATIVREIHRNIEGFIGLLSRWEREERANCDSAGRLRDQDDEPNE
jgi:hypothetical protein